MPRSRIHGFCKATISGKTYELPYHHFCGGTLIKLTRQLAKASNTRKLWHVYYPPLAMIWRDGVGDTGMVAGQYALVEFPKR